MFYWSKASDVETENFRLSSQAHLRAVNIPDAVRCYDTACAYSISICDVLRKTSMKSIPTSEFKCSSDFILSNFNEYVRELGMNCSNIPLAINMSDSVGSKNKHRCFNPWCS